MLSRVANCVFWMSRYIERAENAARFVDVNLNLILDLGGTLANQWDPLIYTTGDHELFYERYGEATQKNAVAMLTFDEENPNSIVSCLKFARENARTIREIIAGPMWEELNQFYLLVKDAARERKSGGKHVRIFQPGETARAVDRGHYGSHDVTRRGVAFCPVGTVTGTGR